jgi:hypothetical protein
MRWIRGTLVALVIPLMALALYAYTPQAFSGRPICLFKILLGMPCPGCGLTRATCLLLHGQLASSLEMHLMCLPVLLYIAIGWLSFVAQASHVSWRPRFSTATVILVVSLLVNHAFRLVSFFAHDGWSIMSEKGLIVRLLN